MDSDNNSPLFVVEENPPHENRHEIILLGELIFLALLLTVHVFFTPSLRNEKLGELPNRTTVSVNSDNNIKSEGFTASSLPLQETVQMVKEPQISPITTPTPTPIIIIPTPSPSPVPTLQPTQKSIAIFGDSMVDTMGERLDYLEHALRKKYPGEQFALYNYGVGSQNVVDGLKRMDEPLVYQDRNYPPLSQTKPDILIIGSFGYNPLFPHDIETYRKTLLSVLTKAKQITPNVYLLSEIAPLKKDFGKGKNGVNWPDDQAYEQATHIIEQLENAQLVAKDLDVPIIDAFHDSIANPNEKEGNPEFINHDDNVHPSIAGHTFMADKIVSTLHFN